MYRNSNILRAALLAALASDGTPSGTGPAPADATNTASDTSSTLTGPALANALAAALAAQQHPEVAEMAARINEASANVGDIVKDYAEHSNKGSSVFARLKGTFSNLKSEAEARMLQGRITAEFERVGIRPTKEKRKALGKAYKEPAPFLLAKQHTSRIVAAFAKGIEGWQNMTLPQLQDATRDETKPDTWRTVRKNLNDTVTAVRKRLRKGGLDADLTGLEGDTLSTATANKARATGALAAFEKAVAAFIANCENAVREMPKLSDETETGTAGAGDNGQSGEGTLAAAPTGPQSVTAQAA